MSRPLIFETPRLRLTPVAPSDAGETAAIMAPSISRMLTTWPERMSPDEAAARIAESIAETRETLWTDWAIRLMDGGALAGWIGLGRKAVTERRLTVGLWLGEDFQGLGYGGEAVVAVVAYARSVSATAVEAVIDSTNRNSLKLFERLGFAPIGEREAFSTVRQCSVACRAFEFLLELTDRRQACVVGTI